MTPFETVRKRDVETPVLENGPAAEGFWRMRLACPDAETLFRPGQFFQLRIDPESLAPLLRRPFAPSETGPESFAFLYQVVGEGTERMTRLQAGDPTRTLLPLGNAWTLAEEGAALLVGGGCGAPSLLTLAGALRSRGVRVCIALGARSRCSLLELERMRQSADSIELATDDGSAGLRGHAVAVAERILDGLEGPVRLYGCGPLPMLRGLAALARGRSLPCEVSLEERMGCGFGACVGCAVKVRDASRPGGWTYQKVCTDGPVFDAADLLWD